MNKCIDSQMGRLLHDYEMGWLADEDNERFELHLMDCEYCFEEVEQFKHVARLLSEDEVVKTTVTDSFYSDEQKAGVWSKFRDLFWPKTNFFLKPAFAYTVVILLTAVIIQQTFIQFGRENRVKPVHMIDLVSTRGPMLTVQPEPGNDLILNFGFEDAVPGRFYQIVLKSERRGLLYSDNRFAFDSRQSGRLIVPYAKLSQGKHILIIEDPADTSITGSDTLRFVIEF